MNTRERLNTAAIYSKWTKAELADWLVAHGTVYPNRAGLLKWSKDDLVNSVTDRVMEAPAYQTRKLGSGYDYTPSQMQDIRDAGRGHLLP